MMLFILPLPIQLTSWCDTILLGGGNAQGSKVSWANSFLLAHRVPSWSLELLGNS